MQSRQVGCRKVRGHTRKWCIHDVFPTDVPLGRQVIHSWFLKELTGLQGNGDLQEVQQKDGCREEEEKKEEGKWG